MLSSTFPRALLPITAVYKSLRQFVLSAAVFAVLFPLVGGQIGPGLFVLPLLFAIHMVMNVGIALLVSTFVVLVPDGTQRDELHHPGAVLRHARHLPGRRSCPTSRGSSSAGSRSSRSSPATRRCSAGTVPSASLVAPGRPVVSGPARHRRPDLPSPRAPVRAAPLT